MADQQQDQSQGYDDYFASINVKLRDIEEARGDILDSKINNPEMEAQAEMVENIRLDLGIKPPTFKRR